LPKKIALFELSDEGSKKKELIGKVHADDKEVSVSEAKLREDLATED